MVSQKKSNKNSKTYQDKKTTKPIRDSKNKEKNYVKSRVEIYGIIVIMLSALFFVSMFFESENGILLKYINDFLSYIFGIGKFIFSFLILVWGISFFFKKSKFLKVRLGLGFVLFFISLIGLFSITNKPENLFDEIFFNSRGGIVGSSVYYGILKLTNKAGTITILSFILLISFLIITNISLVETVRKIKKVIISLKSKRREKLKAASKYKDIDVQAIKLDEYKDRIKISYPESIDKSADAGLKNKQVMQVVENGEQRVNENKFPKIISHVRKNQRSEDFDFTGNMGDENLQEPKQSLLDLSRRSQPTIKAGEETYSEAQLEMDIEKENESDLNYRLPPDSLLKKSKILSSSLYKQDIRENILILNSLFRDFNLAVKVASVIRGPSVTLYELSLSPGVKVQRLLSLEDDFCVALGSSDIRILTPIPGKSAIGIEVPNKIKSIVTLGDVYSIARPEIQKSLLKVPLGKNLSGDIIYMDIKNMPHVLIAGATNSGKSSCINSIIISLLLKVKPSEVKFIMIDPKMVELSIYNGIPHLLAPIITNPKKASAALSWAVDEMENRLKILSDYRCKNVEQFNNEVERNRLKDPDITKLPYILIIIDELADLMIVAASEVEESINRIASMGRAVGLHLIIATQRPSVDIITGVIKANIPSRIAFNVASNTDSRVILDMGGAEKLIGRGDMLYLPVAVNKPERIQGAFVTSNEIEIITDYIKDQRKNVIIKDIFETEIKTEKRELEDDSLIYEALEIFVDFGHASASLLQRRLRIGYSRAARIVDQLENKGFISGYDGSRPREILISKEEFLRFKKDMGLE